MPDWYKESALIHIELPYAVGVIGLFEDYTRSLHRVFLWSSRTCIILADARNLDDTA